MLALFAAMSLAATADGLQPPDATYPGHLAGPPVAHWSAWLPGGRVNSATHTERARPAVVGEHLLVGSAGGEALYLLSRRNGDLVRSFPARSSVESEPTVVGDRVYFTDTGGYTWCYQLDGTLVWQRESNAPILVRPVVADGQVFVTNVDDVAMALDAESGELNWRYQRKPDLTRAAELALYAAPPAVVIDDSVLLGFSDGSLVSLDRVGGDVQWDRRVGEGRYPDLVAAPVHHGTDVFVSGYFKPLVAIDVATRNVRWRLEYGAANASLVVESEPLTVIHHPGTDGKLRTVAAITGAELWEWDSGTAGALTTPVLTEAGLLVGSSDGGLYLIDPTAGELVWEYSEDRLLDGVTAAPVVEGRQVLFVTNAGRIHSMLVPVPPGEDDFDESPTASRTRRPL